jgi:CubicO group peptidase (beta-lactamase class C family)
MLRTLILAWALVLLAGPALGADAAKLEALRARIASGEIQGVHSVIVVQHGKTLAEWYFPGEDERYGDKLGRIEFKPETLHDVRSVSKSVVSILFGIAMADGDIKGGLDTPVLDFFPEYKDLRTPQRMKITLRRVLSMTLGVRWDEDSFPYSDPRNSEIAMDMSPDRLRYVLEQDIAAEPGSTFRYSSGGVELAGAILARATKTPLKAYAQKKLFAPLGITAWDWTSDDKGVPYAASGLRLTPRDMVKIGRMMLAGGVWNGRQIVPKPWVETSTAKHAQVDPDPACGTRYGFYWWEGPGCAASPPAPWYAAIGNGGQRIWVVPSRDLIVVSTMGLYNTPSQRPMSTAVFTGVLGAVGP